MINQIIKAHKKQLKKTETRTKRQKQGHKRQKKEITATKKTG